MKNGLERGLDQDACSRLGDGQSQVGEQGRAGGWLQAGFLYEADINIIFSSIRVESNMGQVTFPKANLYQCESAFFGC